MLQKIEEKQKAIDLRKQGLSYKEILEKIPVAKSTLSLWLRSVSLAKEQKQRLTDKKLSAMKRGWEACHTKSILIKEKIKSEAKKEIGKLTNRELWLIGISLYWAEGSKEKNKSVAMRLSNSDPLMIKLFIKWLIEICKIPKEDIYFEIYLHESARNREEEVQKYWTRTTNFPIEYFKKTRWKKNKLKTQRKNIGEKYFGLVNVNIKKGSHLNRKIQGWISGVCEYCEIV